MTIAEYLKVYLSKILKKSYGKFMEWGQLYPFHKNDL